MKTDERFLLIEVSVLYYLENLTQGEIAKRLFISRSKVSRLLKRARDEHIVNITINYDCDDLLQLKSEIKKRFGIDNILVVKTLSSYDETIKELGKVAAEELYDNIHDDVIIGVSWGRSVRSTVNHLRKKVVGRVKVVELFGAMDNDLNEISMLSIGSTLATKIGGEFYHLVAPLYVEDKQVRDGIIMTPIIQNTLKTIDQCDFILSGLGAIESQIPQYIWDTYLDDNIKQRIVNAGGVGFLCAHFFDENGNFLKIDINDDIIGIPVAKIKQKKIICVAGGHDKARAIHAVLAGGRLHTLITDDKTLKQVLEIDDMKRAQNDKGHLR